MAKIGVAEAKLGLAEVKYENETDPEKRLELAVAKAEIGVAKVEIEKADAERMNKESVRYLTLVAAASTAQEYHAGLVKGAVIVLSSLR